MVTMTQDLGQAVNASQLSSTPALPIASIVVGDRHRHDMGDLAELAANIADVGLLHPIVVRPDGMLIAGERRLKACAALGWADIPVTVVDLDDIKRGELSENVHRKAFLPSEIEAIRRALMPVEAAVAKERMAEGGKGGKLSQPSTEPERARDKVAAFARVSGRHMEKIAALVKAAEDEPEKFGKLVADMDRTGRVDGPYQRLKVARQAEAIRSEPPPLPGKGPYRVIVVDPPWPYERRMADPSHRGVHPYPGMSIEQICALPVASIAHEDCILWLWTTNHHMRFAYQALDAFGFQEKTILTWVKDKMGMGDWLRGQTEHCIMAVRGRPAVTLSSQTTVLYGKAREHSRKPDEFFALVEQLCPAPRYAEFFAREARPNWDGHGDEYAKTAPSDFSDEAAS